MRFIVHAGSEATDVFLCASHILVDGLSMVQILADLLLFLEDPARPAVPVEDKGPIDDRAPRSYRHKPLAFARHLLGMIWDAPNDPARNARLAAKYRGRDKVDWITLELPPEETERLRAASRANGTTVQGALTAACALAVGEREARFGRKRIAVHSPINLRTLMEPPAVDEIGNFAAGTTMWVLRDGVVGGRAVGEGGHRAV